MKRISSYAPLLWSVRAFRCGGEYGPAASVYWNDRLSECCDLYYYLVLIESAQRRIIVNTGLPEDFTEFDNFVKDWNPICRIYRDPCERPAGILGGAGLTPADIDLVLITPLTVYTTGNLALFTNATFCFNRRGWVDFWAPRRHAPRLPLNIAMCRESRLFLADNLSRVRLLDDEEEVCPGVRSFYTGGHHASSMAVSVATERGTVIMGDCFFTYDNLEKNIPIGWAENHHEIHAAYARVRQEADIALPLYDPEVLNRFPDGVIARGEINDEA